MMNCPRVEALLSDHLERLLPRRVSDQMTAHLERCPACRRRRGEMIAIGAGLRQLAAPLPPSDLRRRALDHWAAEQVLASGRPLLRLGAVGWPALTARSPWIRPALPALLALIAPLIDALASISLH